MFIQHSHDLLQSINESLTFKIFMDTIHAYNSIVPAEMDDATKAEYLDGAIAILKKFGRESNRHVFANRFPDYLKDEKEFMTEFFLVCAANKIS